MRMERRRGEREGEEGEKQEGEEVRERLHTMAVSSL